MLISLDEGWLCETVEGGRAWRRSFALEPLDFCARYLLHVDSAPGLLTVRLRGEVVAQAVAAGTPVDVTDFVSLDENELVLCTGEGEIGRVWLQAVPCDT